jgi:serine/threonine protein kinase
MSGSGSDERYTYAPGALLPGTPYKVLRALGAGGMGVVYAVEHTFLKRKEALKTIHPELIDRRDIAERMAREASVVGNLKHPNIVQVTGGGIIDDQWKLPYFAMEMLRGKNLRQVLGKRTLTDFASVYNIAYEVLSALAEAHAHGVVHRDVKPENIFLHFDSTRSAGPQVTAKLLDFGVMAVLGGRQSMSFRGTYKYAAPEQLRGDKVGPQSDIYAMALVVYEMIAGRGPFDDIRDVRGLVKAHMETEAPSISQFARVHASVDDLLARALAKDPAKRPPTAMSFALDLRPLKRAPDAPTVLASNTEESLLTTVTGAVTDGGKSPPARQKRRSARPRRAPRRRRPSARRSSSARARRPKSPRPTTTTRPPRARSRKKRR